MGVSGILSTALVLHGITHLGQTFDWLARTIRRRALDYGLAEPGPRVYFEYEHDDGYQFYMSSTGATSKISDAELDMIIADIVKTFPNLGRRMIDGHLKPTLVTEFHGVVFKHTLVSMVHQPLPLIHVKPV